MSALSCPVGVGVAVGQVLCWSELGEGVGAAASVPGALLGCEGLELGIVAGGRVEPSCPYAQRRDLVLACRVS